MKGIDMNINEARRWAGLPLLEAFVKIKVDGKWQVGAPDDPHNPMNKKIHPMTGYGIFDTEEEVEEKLRKLNGDDERR